jgi:hypothetical protein
VVGDDVDKRLLDVKAVMAEPASAHGRDFEVRLCAAWAVLSVQQERPARRARVALTCFVEGLGTLGLRLFGSPNVPDELRLAYRSHWLDLGGPDLSDEPGLLADFFRAGESAAF